MTARATVGSAYACGLPSPTVEVTAQVTAGPDGFTVLGLPEQVTGSTRDRIRAAVRNSGEPWPSGTVTVTVRPHLNIRYGSAALDAAIAVAVLVASGALPGDSTAHLAVLGELGLDGALRPVRGALSAALAAADDGHRRIIVPAVDGDEASLVRDVRILPAASLREVCAYARGHRSLPYGRFATLPTRPVPRAGGAELSPTSPLLVAAAGGHHTSVYGTPTADPEKWSDLLWHLLPALDEETAVQVTAIQALAYGLPSDYGLYLAPTSEPRPTASEAAMFGTFGDTPGPGAVSLAHEGLLVLNHADRFAPDTLRRLVRPLEQHRIWLEHRGEHIRFPSRFQLLLSTTAGAWPHHTGGDPMPGSVAARHYRPAARDLLDRIDLHLLLTPGRRWHAATIAGAGQVLTARAAARDRWAKVGVRLNRDVPDSVLTSATWRLPAAVAARLSRRVDLALLTPRGFHGVLRVAWTLADLAGRDRPTATDVEVALRLRDGRTTAVGETR